VRLADIRKMPTVLREIEPGSRGAHESLLRSYHILANVEELLGEETPSGVILEIIEDLRAGDGCGIPILGEAR